MPAAIAVLILAYGLSQFYRAILAVLAPALGRDLGMTADDLSLAGGLWFLAFAAMQLPVGPALDRLGPRRTAAALLALGAGGGTALFALAQSPVQIVAAMALIGIGCSPVLMAAYYIFARQFPPALFGTLAGLTVGLGSFGNVAGSLPLAWAVESLGWRATIGASGALSVAVALGILLVVRDPPRLAPGPGRGGGLGTVLRIGAIWPVFLVMLVSYAPAAALRGVWLGPFGAGMHGLDAEGIGWLSLSMGLAMIAGNLAAGPAERLLRSRKRLVLGANLLTAAAFAGLAAAPAAPLPLAATLIVAAGLFGAAFPIVVAHARAFVPAHLTGRGVTAVNLFSIAGAGGLQILTGRLYTAAGGGEAGFALVFGTIAALILAGCAAYLAARDRTD